MIGLTGILGGSFELQRIQFYGICDDLASSDLTSCYQHSRHLGDCIIQTMQPVCPIAERKTIVNMQPRVSITKAMTKQLIRK